MTEKEFAEIVASALIMILRALNRRYNLRMWILTRPEKRQIEIAMSENGEAISPELARYFQGM